MAAYVHIIGFKFKPELSSADRDAFNQRFLSMNTKCLKDGKPYVTVRGGKNDFDRPPAHGMDVVFLVEYQSKEDELYWHGKDEVHAAFRTLCQTNTAGAVILDFTPGYFGSSSGRLLHTGRLLPAVGFGCAGWGTSQDAPSDLFDIKFKAAYASGYRFFDCAEEYGGAEIELGQSSQHVRKDLYLLTKSRDYKPGDTVETILPRLQASVRRMCPNQEKPYVDLFLIHEPTVGPEGRKVLWEAIGKLQELGETIDIGVSNFGIKQLETLPGPKPVVNQIELHPWCQQRELVKYCEDNGIVMQCYAPNARNQKSTDPIVTRVAEEVGKTPTQVLVRWSVQHGYVPLPKSDNPDRIAQNIAVFNFELSKEQMAALDSLGDAGDGPVCKSYKSSTCE